MYNILVGQSGGPTSVINASLYGVVDNALKNENVNKVYGMVHGIEGFLEGKTLDFNEYASEHEIEMLKTTPASFLGSCRYKLPESIDDDVYEKLFQRFKEMDINAVVYIGGNDSMDTVAKLSKYADKIGSDIACMGVPKTVDNDLVCTDHTPGFGSIAKYVATTMKEVILDAGVYGKPVVTIVELMGRHAGWITAASVLARTEFDKNPMLIYLPETTFDINRFVKDVKEALKQQNSVVVCVSEGLVDSEGKLICEYGTESDADAFGHKMLAGCGKIIADIVKEEIGCKSRAVEINLPQRCSAVLASKTDIDEAVRAGSFAVNSIVEKNTGKMIAFERVSEDPYGIEYRLVDVADVCNKEKKFPKEWITGNGADIAEEFVSYVLPLIQGESSVPFENGISKHLIPTYML